MRQRTPDENGIALVVVLVVLAIVTAIVTETSYQAHVDLASAANARDDLRAHYLARSSMNLSRLLLKVQERVLDPARSFLGDMQILEYAPMLLGAFANGGEEAEGLGSLLGLDMKDAKGLGIENGTFSLEADAEDGKINVNCGGGLATETQKERLAGRLAALFLPAQFNPLFEQPKADGTRMDRVQMIQAIIDYTDLDEALFGTQGAAEDYRYETLRDSYKIKNGPFDTLEELQLVQGVDDTFMDAFAASLTIWGPCATVNVNEANALVLAILIIQNAANPDEFQNPQRVLEALTLAQYLVALRTLFFGMGTSDERQFVDFVQNPEQAEALLAVFLPPGSMPPPPPGIQLNVQSMAAAITVGKRRIWRLVASAEVGKVKKRITGVWDVDKVSPNEAVRGGWVYWKED